MRSLKIIFAGKERLGGDLRESPDPVIAKRYQDWADQATYMDEIVDLGEIEKRNQNPDIDYRALCTEEEDFDKLVQIRAFYVRHNIALTDEDRFLGENIHVEADELQADTDYR